MPFSELEAQAFPLDALGQFPAGIPMTHSAVPPLDISGSLYLVGMGTFS